MARVVVQSYGNGMSKAAKELAQYLQVKRVKVTGSQFRGKIGDVVINWGIPRNKLANVKYLNDLNAVSVASNKLKAFQKLKEEGVKVPWFTTNKSDLQDGHRPYVARKVLNGHSGEGIEVFTMNTPVDPIPNAPLYTILVEKKREYRTIVVGDTVVDYKQKKKRASERDSEGNIVEETRIEHDEHVWNLDGGYIFAREGVHKPEGIEELSIKAIKALGLSYGAVDIIESDEGELYVLEINTAFGLEGTSISLVGDAIKRIIDDTI